ncbi:MAG: hypothetical protein RIN55_05135 [Tissierellaceae bacterium]|nr:hypothetical protein [Tissierellaceae bacterium]
MKFYFNIVALNLLFVNCLTMVVNGKNAYSNPGFLPIKNFWFYYYQKKQMLLSY